MTAPVRRIPLLGFVFPRTRFLGFALLVFLLSGTLTAAQSAISPRTRDEQELFLQKARVMRTRTSPTGTTRTLRATLAIGALQHDVSIQTIDAFWLIFRGEKDVHLRFKDSYKFNIAAYRLALLLGLDNVPPSVERGYDRRKAAFTWWIDDVFMDEKERIEKRIEPPDAADWNDQMNTIRLFDQLIDNTDRNLGNLLITRDWKAWMIDHSRAFRPTKKLRAPENLKKCDRTLLVNLKALTKPLLKQHLGRYLDDSEINSLLARRDEIVRHFELAGEPVLYDSKRRVVQVAGTPAP